MLLLLLSACLLLDADDLDARFDMDGDGVPRPDDCDDTDASVGRAQAWYVDLDGDGVGVDATVVQCRRGAHAERGGDCDDSDPAVFPGSEERCNERDDDCDGEIDEGVEVPRWYLDGDLDGYGSADTALSACEAPASYVDNNEDCDDSDPSLSPLTPWYPDEDEDLWGDEAGVVFQCTGPAGFVRVGSDCDDADETINPYGTEVCDEWDADEDCSGQADDLDAGTSGPFHLYYADADGDGWGDPDNTDERCDPSTDWVDNGRDCDDQSPDVGDCGWAKIAMGTYASCGLLSSGGLECWGDRSVVDGAPDGAFLDVDIAWATWACAVDSAGALSCWGTDPGYGLLDPPSGSWSAVCISGTTQACALDADGRLSCWGGSFSYRQPPEGAVFRDLACGVSSACGIDAAGGVTCWGYNWHDLDHELDLPGERYTQVAISDTHMCGLTDQGAVDCIAPDHIDLGQDSIPGTGHTAVGASTTSTIAVDAAGVAHHWAGISGYPMGVVPEGRFESLDGSRFSYCGVTETGEGLCWGCTDPSVPDHGQCEVPELD